MCRNVIRYTLAIVAVILCSLCFLVVTLRISLLRSDTYKSALNSVDVYSYLEKSVRDYLPGRDAKPDEGGGVYVILEPILDGIDIKSLSRDIVETNLDNITHWLNSSDETLYIYFPREKLLSSVSYEDIETSVFSEYRARIKQLKKCTPEEQKQIDNDELVPECLPEGFKVAKAEADLKEILMETFGDDLIAGALDEAGLGHLSERTPIETIITNQPGSNLDDTLNTLQNIKTVFYLAVVIPLIGLILVSILILMVAALGRPSLRTVSANTGVISLFTGIILAVIAVLGQNISGIILDRLPLENANLPVNLTDIKVMAETLLHELTYSVFQVTLITGGALILGGIILIIASLFLKGAPKATDSTEK